MSIWVALITAGCGLITAAWTFSRVKEKELFFENRRLKIELYRKFLISINKMAAKTNAGDLELLNATEELLESYYELLPIASVNSIIEMDNLISTLQKPRLPNSYEEQEKAFNIFVREIRKDIKIDILNDKTTVELPGDFMIRVLVINPQKRH